MGKLIKLDYEHGRGWTYAIINQGAMTEFGSWPLFEPDRVVADCPTREAREAAYRLLSGQCASPG